MIGKNVVFPTKDFKKYLFDVVRISVELGVQCGKNELKMTEEELVEYLQKENWELIVKANI